MKSDLLPFLIFFILFLIPLCKDFFRKKMPVEGGIKHGHREKNPPPLTKPREQKYQYHQPKYEHSHVLENRSYESQVKKRHVESPLEIPLEKVKEKKNSSSKGLLLIQKTNLKDAFILSEILKRRF